ncbi:MAG: ADP-ribosylglycohydrolase family protein, partial [Lachnospiraceae bacterium]|nr:ADP-ribosylglycohydrolase family protein [Lachnospiraceae bacterium]
GLSTRKAIKRMMWGINPLYCGGKWETENGNGALMRILPLAFLKDRYTEEEFIKLIEDVASLTHRHKRSKLACIFYIEFAIHLIKGKDKTEAYNHTIDYLSANCKKRYRSEFKYFKDILSKQIISSNREKIKSTGYVIDTLEAVLWCLFQNDTYEKTVLCAVNLGGDTDTIAALVGGLAGICYGFSAIPDRWVQNVAKKEDIEEMVRIFSLNI